MKAALAVFGASTIDWAGGRAIKEAAAGAGNAATVSGEIMNE